MATPSDRSASSLIGVDTVRKQPKNSITAADRASVTLIAGSVVLLWFVGIVSFVVVDGNDNHVM